MTPNQITPTGTIAADRQYLKETFLDDSLPDGNYVYLEISDNGCGMDEATREAICVAAVRALDLELLD